MRLQLLLLFALFCLSRAQFQQVVGLPNSQAITDVSYSGFVQVDPAKDDAKLFGWFFPSRSNPKADPVVLWMTGGPGCSSELAVLFENGPFSVDTNLNLVPNPYSWTNNASVIFIDQPFGTGFSPKPRGDVVYNEEIMAKYVFNFLQGFFKYFPDYFNLPFFITGESYAGHYIPALSYYIVQKNAAGNDPKLNLQGVAIGNGWVDPKIQYNYEPYSVQNDLVVKGSREDNNLIRMYSACEDAINTGNFVLATDICNLIMENVVLHAPKIDGYYINHYNIKEPCVEASLCYDFTNQTDYMNLPATQKALGIQTHMEWASCSSIAGAPLIVDRMRPYSDDLPPVLAANVRVLVYSGMWDLICEYLGGERWLSLMNWPGQDAFNQASYSDWKVDSVVAGHFKAVQGLTWLEVEKAGHMVPHDQPAAAYNMLQHFLMNTPFSS